MTWEHRWGHAHRWNGVADRYGIPISTDDPWPGSIAVWEVDGTRGTRDRLPVGHVAYVETVHPDGAIEVTEMNLSDPERIGTNLFRLRRIIRRPGEAWYPDSFIHIESL